jgi:hypothetical protein
VASPESAPAPIPFDIGEEFGTAKKNLPPAKVVLIVLGVLLVIGGIFAILQRPKPAGGGAVGEVVAVEIPDQNAVMVAINVSFQNDSKQSFTIQDIKVDLDTGNSTFTDDAASAVDFNRYFQAFPALKEHAIAALMRETKIPPGGQATGTIIVSFPITTDQFKNRKWLKVSIIPHDQPVPIVLTK